MARLLLVASLFLLTACGDEDHYPISGEECRQGDPVQDMDASDFDCPTGV